MNKLEKYINYIVDDLVKGSVVDREENEVVLPFLPEPYYPISSMRHTLDDVVDGFPFYPMEEGIFFYDYLKEKYGAHSEEIQTVWGIYKEILIDLIKK